MMVRHRNKRFVNKNVGYKSRPITIFFFLFLYIYLVIKKTLTFKKFKTPSGGTFLWLPLRTLIKKDRFLKASFQIYNSWNNTHISRSIFQGESELWVFRGVQGHLEGLGERQDPLGHE